ncbi:FMN-dependent NADH-azoreductase [Natronospirillum operosum]|uniref:FMN dependent NADH:quinone oxidoreductase n=1 Tax=Natronospirillum operosum TaxID=2759953 RepID=A0A4Z0WAZ4_9GAMM|nr:NAD(P)H-dependent oxidoreductase [Natronospirillum operosum]TGG91716.1 FMN-dependent NADH-azoreductase [Natronospirillum operosum]
MSTLLKIQSSLFNEHGQSSALIDHFVKNWQELNPEGTVVNRNLAENPIPHLDLPRFQAFATNPSEMTEVQREVVAQSDALIEELNHADVIVLGVPMYNFQVPSVLHTYFDHIARADVTFRYSADGPEGLIKGKKAYIFITRGGVYGEDHAQTNFLREILGFIGITDIEFIHAEGLAISEDTKAESLAAAEQRIMQLMPKAEFAL